MLKFNHDNLKDLQDKFAVISEFSHISAARDFYYLLDELLLANKSNKDKTLFKEFKIIKAKFGFLSIPILPEDDIIHLYKYYFNLVFDIPNYNIWSNFKKYLASFLDYEYRDKVKNEIKNILIKNNTEITKTHLAFNNKESHGTVANWLRDYNGYMSSLNVADKLKLQQYFIDSSNIKKLTDEEKNKIKLLVQFYEKLKLSSKTPEGFEDKVPVKIGGKLMIWNSGRLEDVDPAAKRAVEDLKKLGFFKDDMQETNLAELKQMLNQYPEGSLERRVIEEEIEKLNR